MKEKRMENTKEYKSNDFYQSVVLKTIGFPLMRLEKGSSRFFYFIFADPDNKAKEAIEKYWNSEITVDARKLIENINELKTRIYSQT